MHVNIPYELQKMNSLFKEGGFAAYLVGGAVRDEIMGKRAHDWDIATNASPQQVIKIFHRVIPTGIKHGTVTVHFMKKEIEVTTFRTEGAYSDGRHPDNVEFASTIEEDLSRRDFTMNAIAASLQDGSIVDPFEGQKDIKKKIIRTVGEAHERFMEDGLRPIRAIRFASQLNFSIEEKTLRDIYSDETLKKISRISPERFRDEFCKIMLSPLPSLGLRLMEETGILSLFIPELLSGRGCTQTDYRGFHQFDVLDHNFYACDGSPREKLNVRLAALFHDIGKPAVKKIIPSPEGSQITFYCHDSVGAKMVREIMARLKFSNAEIDNVSHLVKEHMFHYESSWTDAAVRRFIQRVGKENIEDLFDLRLADVYGMHNCRPRVHDSITGAGLVEFQDRIDSVLAQKSALSLKDLAVNGKDLMEEGIPSGQMLGKILKQLFETVTDDPEMNTREKLLPLASNLFDNFSKK